jgi:hypothetical protein
MVLTAIFRTSDRMHLLLLVLASAACGNIAAIIVFLSRNKKE